MATPEDRVMLTEAQALLTEAAPKFTADTPHPEPVVLVAPALTNVQKSLMRAAVYHITDIADASSDDLCKENGCSPGTLRRDAEALGMALDKLTE